MENPLYVQTLNLGEPPLESPIRRNLDDSTLSRSIYWTPCAPSPDVRLGPDFLDNDWSVGDTTASPTPNHLPSLSWKNLPIARQYTTSWVADDDTTTPFHRYRTPKRNCSRAVISNSPKINKLPTIPSLCSIRNLPPLANAPFLDQDPSELSDKSQPWEIPFQTPPAFQHAQTAPWRVKFCQGSPVSISQRLDALDLSRPAAVLFVDKGQIPSALQNSQFLQEALLSSYSTQSSFRLDNSVSSVQPFPSTASIVRFFSNDNKKCSYPSSTDERQSVEDTFNDSGLDFPLSDSPESWGIRKNDRLRNPNVLRLRSAAPVSFADSDCQYQDRSLFHAHLHIEPPSLGMKVDAWTFEEHLVISLLKASEANPRKDSGAMKHNHTKQRLLARASDKIIKATKRCISMLVSVQ